MFTGIIEELGTLRSIKKGEKSSKLVIGASLVLKDTKIGDSIAVNGVCLTVTQLGHDEYEADVMAETVARSTLGLLTAGTKLNLERAMLANGRFGGHIVSGHIDGTGKISEIQKEDNAVWYTIKTENNLLRYIVEKGSITIDGISLTIAYVDGDCFKVSVIPHTRHMTNLSYHKIGDSVNLECDVLGKYIEKLMLPKKEEKKTNLSEAFLIENGFK